MKYAILKSTILKTVYVTTILLSSFNGHAQLAKMGPLSPEIPHTRALEVPVGTQKLVEKTFSYNLKEDKVQLTQKTTTSFNNQGNITSQYRKDYTGDKARQERFFEYNDQGLVMLDIRYFIENGDTISQVSKLRYEGTNPLCIHWETDMESFTEKYYLDKAGIVIKRERLETAADPSSINILETYEPSTNQVFFKGYFPEGGSEDYIITYDGNHVLKEESAMGNEFYLNDRFERDNKGNVLVNKRSYEPDVEPAIYLKRTLQYHHDLWVLAIIEIDIENNIEPGFKKFIVREVTINGIELKPESNQVDLLINNYKNTKSKLPW